MKPSRTEFYEIADKVIPALFLGVISSRPEDHPVAHALPASQFIYGHQYHGHSCLQAYLRGIFVPVETISDAAIKQLLLEMPNHYGIDSSTSDEAFASVDAQLRRLGAPPLRPPDPNTGSSEGLFRFEPQPLLDWIRPFGKYIFECNDPDDIRTAPLEWLAIEELARWLSGYGKLPLRSTTWMPKHRAFQTNLDDVVGGFVYQNGD